MKAIGYRTPGTIDRADALEDIELPRPVPTGRDLLVAVRAVSVNPVDTKVRNSARPAGDGWKVLGWDAVGQVVEVGDGVVGFKPVTTCSTPVRSPAQGATASSISSTSASSVASRNRCRMPRAAALPLTALTAWEMLFDRSTWPSRSPRSERHPDRRRGWRRRLDRHPARPCPHRSHRHRNRIAARDRGLVRELGADHVIDHSRPLAEQVAALGIGAPAFVFSTTETLRHLSEIVELIAPQGRFGLIDDPDALDVTPVQAQSRLDPLGADVHPLDLPDGRYERTGPDPRPGRATC